MGGLNFPVGYTQRADTIYTNSDKTINNLKNGKDLVTVSVIDSRGNKSSYTKELTISVYKPPYFAEIEAIRVNDIETGVRLKGIGKKAQIDDINYIKYTTSTQEWINGASSGTKYGPFTLNLSEVTYNSDDTEFYLNSLIQGDLGASGFTFGQKFYLKVEIATNLNVSFPFYSYTDVKTGKILMSYANEGVSYGGDYDEIEGGPLQFYGKRVDKTTNIAYTLASGFTASADENSLKLQNLTKQCLLQFSLIGEISANTSAVVATIPVGYRPSKIILTAGTAGTGGWIQVAVTPAGEVKLYSPATITSPRGQVIWYI